MVAGVTAPEAGAKQTPCWNTPHHTCSTPLPPYLLHLESHRSLLGLYKAACFLHSSRCCWWRGFFLSLVSNPVRPSRDVTFKAGLLPPMSTTTTRCTTPAPGPLVWQWNGRSQPPDAAAPAIIRSSLCSFTVGATGLGCADRTLLDPTTRAYCTHPSRAVKPAASRGRNSREIVEIP